MLFLFFSVWGVLRDILTIRLWPEMFLVVWIRGRLLEVVVYKTWSNMEVRLSNLWLKRHFVWLYLKRPYRNFKGTTEKGPLKKGTCHHYIVNVPLKFMPSMVIIFFVFERRVKWVLQSISQPVLTTVTPVDKTQSNHNKASLHFI